MASLFYSQKSHKELSQKALKKKDYKKSMYHDDIYNQQVLQGKVLTESQKKFHWDRVQKYSDITAQSYCKKKERGELVYLDD